MIVSDKFRCLYVSIPMTGGARIEQAILELDPKATRINADMDARGHFSGTQLEPFLTEEQRTYYTFTFVRNPYDWFAINYNYFSSKVSQNMRTWAMLNDYHKIPPLKGEDGVAIIDGAMAMSLLAMMQYDFYGQYLPKGSHGSMVCQSSWLDIDMNFVGKLENFEENWETICRNIKFPVTHPMPDAEPIKSKFHQVNISPQAKHLIQAAFRKDFIDYYQTLL